MTCVYVYDVFPSVRKEILPQREFPPPSIEEVNAAIDSLLSISYTTFFFQFLTQFPSKLKTYKNDFLKMTPYGIL